ncbi:MAG: NAD(P)-dependent oxidoreductase, partial [Balneolales bacterium]
MKKALVTGLSGFLGKAIIPYLAGHYKITMLSRSVLAKKSKVAADYIQVDLVKEGISESTSKEWDVVIHAAGKAHSLPQTDEERKAFFDVNLKGTRNLVESLENNLPRSFVFISTIAVYGLVNGEAITEDTPLKARDPYGLSKLKAERFLLDWADRKGVNLTILRLPLLAGPEAPGNLGVMIKGINLGRYVRIGQGQARKSVLWAEDIANIIPHLENISGTYNLTDG